MNKPNPTVRQIVSSFLKNEGFDGLQDGDDCGCRVGDLMPCGDGWTGCMAGYLQNLDDCDCPDSDFCIGPDKQPKQGR